MFTTSSEDASASSSSTANAQAAVCSDGDNVSTAAATVILSPLRLLDSTLSALLEEELEQDEPPEPDAELLLPIDDYTFAAVDDSLAREQQFGLMSLPGVAAAEHSALQTQLSSAASEFMQLTSGYSDECFAAALAGGGYMGLDEPLCPQQQHSCAGEMATAQGCFFSKDTHGAQRGFFGGGGGSCTGMVMSMFGMDEIGEYQRMMECGGPLLGTHTGGADMAFGNAAAEMQVGSRTRDTPPQTEHDRFHGGGPRWAAAGARCGCRQRGRRVRVWMTTASRPPASPMRKGKRRSIGTSRRGTRGTSARRLSTLAEKPSQTVGLASAAGSPRTTTTASHPRQSAPRITKNVNRWPV
ncbi:hypothetical protein GUJ93_ZPchr0010g8749 [Zizania palustris]|nr:hypothetical protein GUJ93_ZPchr0010g8749 [Zizania palustris]